MPPPDESVARPKARLRFNAGFAAAGMIYNQAVTVLSGVLIGRIVGAADYGIANIAKNLFQIAAIVTPLGLDLALQRYLAGRVGDDPRQRAVLHLLRLLTSALALLPAMVLALGLGWWLERHIYRYAGFEWIILATFAALPFATDAAVTGGAYRGIRRPAPAVLATYVIQPTVRVAAIAVLFLLGWRLWAIVAATTAAAVASWLYVFVRARRDFPVGREAFDGALGSAKGVLGYSWAMGVSLVVTMMTKSVDVLVLGHFRPSGEVGRYVAVQLLVSMLALFSSALGQTLGASVTERFQADDVAGVERQLTHNMRRIALVTAPLYALILFWGNRIDLVLGHSFVVDWRVVALLATNQLLIALFAFAGFALSMTGRQTVEAWIILGGLVVTLAVSLALVPAFGGAGAAVATLVAMGSVNFVRFGVVRRLLSIHLFKFSMLTPFLIALPIAAGVRAATGAFDPRTFLSTAIEGLTMLGLYAASTWFCLLRDEERRQFRPLFRRMARRSGG